MAPRHILPLRTVRVVLEVEVPHTVLVEHAVRVVHPSVSRCVMIYGAILLAVGGVERVGILHILPTSKACQFAVCAVASVDVDVEREVLLAAEVVYIKRYIIVDVVGGRTLVFTW